MKRAFLNLSLALALALSFAISVQAEETREIQGTILDSMCLSGHQANVGDFVKKHNKSCVLMPNCRASGMNIYQEDGTILKLDDAGSKKVVAFLKNSDSDSLDVIVEVKKNATGETYQLISIREQ